MKSRFFRINYDRIHDLKKSNNKKEVSLFLFVSIDRKRDNKTSEGNMKRSCAGGRRRRTGPE